MSQSPTLAAKSPPAESYFLRTSAEMAGAQRLKPEMQRINSDFETDGQASRVNEHWKRSSASTRRREISYTRRSSVAQISLLSYRKLLKQCQACVSKLMPRMTTSLRLQAMRPRCIVSLQSSRSGQEQGALVEDLIQQHVLEEQQAQRMAMRMRRLREKRYASNTDDGVEAAGGKSSTSEEEPEDCRAQVQLSKGAPWILEKLIFSRLVMMRWTLPVENL